MSQSLPTENFAVNDNPPNILFIMTDQQRADALQAAGNPLIFTPNMDRLAARGVQFRRAYSTCPVCVPARYTIRTGREPHTTGIFSNAAPDPVEGQPAAMEERCGPYLARTMASLGYRTFGIGKFHSQPRDEDLGYEVHLHSEELFGSPEDRKKDAYCRFIAGEHPAFSYIEDYMGERTEMYYMPQQSPLPPELTVESWAADRAVEQIQSSDSRPYFGFVSFIGPHPPLAPPIPFNRMYNPDEMPNPIRGDIAVDHMDEQIPWMNHAVWAEDINDAHARVLRARYYGEISYIDQCLGRILDAVDARDDAANTLICFYSDHGDHLGDHHGWQKESYFDVSCRVPFLLSWPDQLDAGAVSDNLVCLTDLFGIATTAAGAPDLRDGSDVLGALSGAATPRERVIGLYGTPGTPRFKVMVREGDWKYIYFANGGTEQLFNLAEDPHELRQRAQDKPDVTAKLRATAAEAVNVPNANRALQDGSLKAFPFEARPLRRIVQMDRSRGVSGFPENPGDLIAGT
ncbi:MAG: sulfatase-like hydrolase/transferase [Candidatus Hydrogenedentes bacterium]|nr:sulfatase-like hydrolase/transferase [Candidatus Hydrogenedentota bacterium]